MFSNLLHKINQKYNEFLYSHFSSRVKNLFSDDDHIIAHSAKSTINQPTKIDLQERFKTFKENPLMFLSYIKSFDQFASHLPDENLRKELIEHYEKEVLPTLKGNAAEKMDDFIKCYKKAEEIDMSEYEIIAHDDCLLSDKELDMSEWNVVAPDDCPLPDKEIDMDEWEIVENEQPGTNMRIEGKAIFGLIGRFLG